MSTLDLPSWQFGSGLGISRLLRQASAARGYLVSATAIGLVATVLVLAQAGLLARLLAGAARGVGFGVLGGSLVALAVVLALRAAASYGSEVTALRAAARVKSQLRRKLAAHVLRLGPAWLTGRRAGEISTLSTTGLDALDSYFARYLPQLVLACLVPVAVLIRVALADWVSAIIIAVTLPLILVFAVLIGRRTRAQTQRQWRLLAHLGGHFVDVVEGLPTLKVFGRAKAQAEMIRKVTDEYRSAAMSILRVAFLSALVLELAATLATALVAVEVGLRLLAGHMEYQTALLVLLLTPEAYLPLRNLSAQFHARLEGATAAESVLRILDIPAPADHRPARALVGGVAVVAPAASTPGALDLRHQPINLHSVTLCHPGRPCPALDEVSLTVHPGEHLVVTGPTGAGKSSLLALLLRFAEPTSGAIEVGGHPLACLPLREWRSQLAWVPQHPHLFAASVTANIAIGRPDATEDEIRRAAALAGADGFIERLPASFRTRLGERGLDLSAGQRQRIALARAFLRDAPLLLLDEPTAHLDPFSAAALQEALARLTAHRTVLQVTHDPATAAAPHRVLELRAGRLSQQLPGRGARLAGPVAGSLPALAAAQLEVAR